MDIDGRVLRVDSFSKIMMPGMRLGWITSSPLFHEHLVSLTDSSTQHPHGFGQIFVTEMLSAAGWGLAGFDRWVRGLQKEYQRRRDVFLQHFADEVTSTGLASAEPPQAGMFVWIEVHVRMHPRYRTNLRDAEGCEARTNVPELMDELFERCLDAGLVVMPASIFVPPVTSEAPKLLANDDSIQNVSDCIDVKLRDLSNVCFGSKRVNFLRTTFAGEESQMQPALKILGQVLRDFFNEPKLAFSNHF
jgi:aromatic amino acid aminotransferase I / 2-aminoadipate transaminase